MSPPLHDYKVAAPIIAQFFADAAIQDITFLTADNLNELYDLLSWQRNADESRHKANLLKWIRRNMPQFEVERGSRFAATALIKASMATSPTRSVATPSPRASQSSNAVLVQEDMMMEDASDHDYDARKHAFRKVKRSQVAASTIDVIDLSGYSPNTKSWTVRKPGLGTSKHASEEHDYEHEQFLFIPKVHRSAAKSIFLVSDDSGEEDDKIQVHVPRNICPVKFENHGAEVVPGEEDKKQKKKKKKQKKKNADTNTNTNKNKTRSLHSPDPSSTLPQSPSPLASTDMQSITAGTCEQHVSIENLRRIFASAERALENGAVLHCLMEIAHATALVHPLLALWREKESAPADCSRDDGGDREGGGVVESEEERGVFSCGDEEDDVVA